MIKINDYYNFIDKKENLSNCQKKILKYLSKNINKIYVERESNKQLYTYIYNAYKDESIIKISKIILLLQKFTSYKNAIKIVNLVKEKKLTDTDVINKIKEFNNNKLQTSDKHGKHGKYDIYNICSSWKYTLENIAFSYKNIFNNSDNIKYLDIGCGNGHKTQLFGKLLEISNDNIYGTDIKQWGPYEQTNIKYNFNFKFIKENGDLDYKDNTFDLITCFLMLHHVEKLEDLIKEIKRILKPNGILLIIEHDCHDDYDLMILNILHTLYSFLVDNNSNFDYAKYYNWAEWDYIFSLNNFSYIKSNYIFNSIEHDTRFDNIYYTFYKNNK